MRKFVSIAGLICIALMLAGCSVKIANKDMNPFVSVSFEKKTGEITSLATSIPSPKLPIIFGIGFEKKPAGKLEVTIEDPKGKEVFRDTVQANDTYMHKKPVPEPLKYNWGFYSFNKVMDDPGTYTIKVIGNDATGALELTSMQNSAYINNFTGTAVKISADVTDTSKELGFYLAAMPTQSSGSGIFLAKIIDPDGIEIQNTRLTISEKTPAPALDFWEKPAKKGTYTAIIETKEASGSVSGYVYDEKPIDFMAFVKPSLMVLIGIALYLMIKSKDRRIMVWGGLFWLIATFFVNIVINYIVSNLIPNLVGPYSGLTAGIINTVSMSIVSVLMMYFSRFISEVKKCSPTELVAFVYGFIFVNPLLAGLSGLMDISNKNGSFVPGYATMTIPGQYPSSNLAMLDIGTSVINMICACLGTFAVLTVFLWVIRQKEAVKPSTLWLMSIGAIGLKIVIDFAQLYANQSIIIMTIGKPIITMRMTFGFAPPIVEALLSTGVLVAIGVLVIINWKKIMGLALKACPVTIDDLTHKEA